MLFQLSFHHIVTAPSRGLGVGRGSELAMDGGAGDRRGGGDLVGVESGGGSFHLRVGAGAVGFPYLLFFIYFFLSRCGASGGVISTKAWRPDASG